MVLHQGLQGRDNDSKSFYPFTAHQSRELECDGFSSACRKNSQKRFSFNRSLHRFLLQIFSFIGTERIIFEKIFQSFLTVKCSSAISTFVIFTRRIPQTLHHPSYLRVIMQYPKRNAGTAIPTINQRQAISQFHRIRGDQFSKRRRYTYFFIETLKDTTR